MKDWVRVSRRRFLLILTVLPALVSFQGVGQPTAPDDIHLVLLREPSVLQRALSEKKGDSRVGNTQALVSKPNHAIHQGIVEETQKSFLRELQRTGLYSELEVTARRTYLLNLLFVRGSVTVMDQLREIPAVQAVYPNEVRYPLMDAAPEVVGAPEAWEALGGIENAGSGVLIGIFDDGINPDHPMFDDDGLTLPPGYPLGDPAYTNNKVIVARSYACPEFGYDVDICESAEARGRHGSATAGIAAGGNVDAPLAKIRGIAPMAYLGNYNVFGSAGLATTAAIVAAIEDAVLDGMDVLNLSLGGGDISELEHQVISLATEAGLVVVIAAGNDGPAPKTINSPGTSADGITVGASYNGRIFGAGLTISSENVVIPPELEKIRYKPGNSIEEVIGPFPLASIAPLDPSEDACNLLPVDSLEGHVALVRRGTCLFTTKAENALAAGAVGVIAYNNVDEQFPYPDGLGGIAEPFVLIQRNPGEQLRDLLIGAEPVFVTFGPSGELLPFPFSANRLADFSSRGPNFDYEIKPDLVAPGELIYTATNQAIPEPQFWLNAAGTSFSAPIVAGAAALIRQLYPDWTAKAIKSALVNTASRGVTWKGEPARIMQAGNGLLDLAGAIKAVAALDPVSASFGLIKETVEHQLNKELRLTNLSPVDRTFEIEVIESYENSSVDLFVSPETISLEAGQTIEVTLSAQLDSPLFAGAFEGFIIVTDTESGSQLTSPFWGGLAVGQPSVLEVSKSDGGQFRSLVEAVEAAGPGDVVEISDSETYKGSISVGLSEEGIPQNGLTIRAAPGQNPSVDASESDSPAILVENVEGVTIEGLSLKGGRNGIYFREASGIVRNNLIEQSKHTSDSHGISLLYSGAHIYDNTISDNGRSGLAIIDSGALVHANTISGNSANGVLSDGGIFALFDNQIVENTANIDAQNIRVLYSLGLIKNNTVSDNQGPLGDGLQIRDAATSVTIQDNLVAGNRRMGISLLDGAHATVFRNQIKGNQGFGLSLEGDSFARVEASRFVENLGGIKLVSSTLEMTDSLIAQNEGSGILSQSSLLDVFNSSIAENAEYGIALSETEGVIANSILSQNLTGDLQVASSQGFLNNLIGDGQLEGTNGNLSGNPLFGDPSAVDFSLRAASPAIDRGIHNVPVSQGDLLGHGRVTDGNNDGSSSVDLGAIEFGSAYSAPLILPILSVQEEEFVGVACTNGFHKPAQVLMRAYDLSGKQFGSYQCEVEAAGQHTVLLHEAFDNLQEGWVEILTSQPDLMSLTLMGDYTLSFMDGVRLSKPLGTKLVFPEVHLGDHQTWLYLVNPIKQPLEVLLTWSRPDGSFRETIYTLPGKGMLAKRIDQLFEETSSWNGFGGYLTAEALESGSEMPAEASIFGMELFGNAMMRAGLLARDYQGGTGELFAAHFACSEEIETTLNIVSVDSDAEVTVEAFDESGEILEAVTLDALPANAQFHKKLHELLSLPKGMTTGWLKISCKGGRLMGSITYGDPKGRFLTSQPLQEKGSREFLLGQIAHSQDIFTGITLLNPSTFGALATVEVFDPDGQKVGISFLELAPGQKLAKLLTELMPELQTQIGGFLRVRSNVPLFGFEIFGNWSLDYLSATQPQVLVH